MSTRKGRQRQYRCPSSDEQFKFYWTSLIDEVAGKDSFRESHLLQLKILCDLYVDHEKLKAIVDVAGYTYTISGRNGDQQKTTPEFTEMMRVRGAIKDYSRQLGLQIGKELAPTEDAEEDNWD